MNHAPHKPTRLAGRRVTVVGLGRFGGGLGVTRWLVEQGARVTVSDRSPADDLAESVAALKDVPVALHLGRHEEPDFLEADLLVVNPAVPKDMPLLLAAEREGVRRTSEINLFLERCPCRVVGITGSVGKSTTTAMTGAVLATTFRAHVGGNIGRSLLGDLAAMTPDDVAVLELSSFQLEDLPLIGISPHVALVTNLQPNHLDRHGTMDAYGAAKRNLFRYQSTDDVLILNRADAATADWEPLAPGHVRWFDPAGGEPFELNVPGVHNQANAQAAWAIGETLGVDRAKAVEALQAFAGLPHRLQFVADVAGVRYYNDSKSTTPGGAIVAIEAFEPGTVILLAGGYDKGIAFDELGAAIVKRAKAVVAYGATRGRILAAVEAHRTDRHTPAAASAPDLSAALDEAVRLAHSGDAIVLSPGCASYDQFPNYEHRGDLFVDLVSKL